MEFNSEVNGVDGDYKSDGYTVWIIKCNTGETKALTRIY